VSRVIGVFQSSEQASALIDDLRNVGLDRKDMIVSQMSDDPGDMSVSLKDTGGIGTRTQIYADLVLINAVFPLSVLCVFSGIISTLQCPRPVSTSDPYPSPAMEQKEPSDCVKTQLKNGTIEACFCEN